MILDTSAIVAVILGESDADALEARIAAESKPRMSAATEVELHAVMRRLSGPEHARLVTRLLQAWNVEIVPFDDAQSLVACRAYDDFGKGSGHPARLNLGDCFSYALASTSGEPLLFVGSDFTHTDVEAA